MILTKIVPTMSFEIIKGEIEGKWKQEIEIKIAAVRVFIFAKRRNKQFLCTASLRIVDVVGGGQKEGGARDTRTEAGTGSHDLAAGSHDLTAGSQDLAAGSHDLKAGSHDLEQQVAMT